MMQINGIINMAVSKSENLPPQWVKNSIQNFVSFCLRNNIHLHEIAEKTKIINQELLDVSDLSNEILIRNIILKQIPSELLEKLKIESILKGTSIKSEIFNINKIR